MSRRLYIQSEGQALGPASIEEIKSLMEGGWVSGADMGRWEDEEDWKTVDSLLNAVSQEGATLESTPSAKPKSIKIPLSNQPARQPARNWIMPVCITGIAASILIGLGVFWKPKTGNHSASAGKQTDLTVSNLPVAPPPGARILTNAAVKGTNSPASGTLQANPVKPAPKPASVPMIATVALQPTNTTPAVTVKTAPPRRQIVTTFGIKGVGEYDAILIRKVQQRWMDLIERARVAGNRTGRVVLEFQLHAGGRADHTRVLETDMDELPAFLCESAVLDSSPFAPWPAAMRRSVKSDTRLMQFTFCY